MKKIIQVCILIICLLLAGCSDNAEKSEIIINANEEEISYFLTAESFTTKDDFGKAFSEIDTDALVYVPRDSVISLNLNDKTEVESIKAYWINEKGFPNYRDAKGFPLYTEVNVEKHENSEYSFTVEYLMQTALSSYYEENEKIIVGYVVELREDGKIQYCYFMIITEKNR